MSDGAKVQAIRARFEAARWDNARWESVAEIGDIMKARAAFLRSVHGDMTHLLDALAQAERERDAAARKLQSITDIAVLALHDVWANSGRDGYNPWYFTATMGAHENIAKVLGTGVWDILYDAQDRKAARRDADDAPADDA